MQELIKKIEKQCAYSILDLHGKIKTREATGIRLNNNHHKKTMSCEMEFSFDFSVEDSEFIFIHCKKDNNTHYFSITFDRNNLKEWNKTIMFNFAFFDHTKAIQDLILKSFLESLPLAIEFLIKEY